jgi:hypothetical protein
LGKPTGFSNREKKFSYGRAQAGSHPKMSPKWGLRSRIGLTLGSIFEVPDDKFAILVHFCHHGKEEKTDLNRSQGQFKPAAITFQFEKFLFDFFSI